MIPAIITQLHQRLNPDSTENYHINCPFCSDKKQHLYIKQNGKTSMYHCWKCDRSGYLKKSDAVFYKILNYNIANPPGMQTTSEYPTTPVITPAKIKQAIFHTDLITFLTDTRKFSIEQTLWIIKKFHIKYNDNKVIFPCYYRKDCVFTFHKDILSGLYKNATGNKFAFNFNAIFSKKDYVVLVEGVFDALRLLCYGIPAIALLGKAFGLTSYMAFCKHIGNKKIFIMLDGDIKNEDKTLRLKLKRNLSNPIVLLKINSEGDPDEYYSNKKNLKILKAGINSAAASKVFCQV